MSLSEKSSPQNYTPIPSLITSDINIGPAREGKSNAGYANRRSTADSASEEEEEEEEYDELDEDDVEENTMASPPTSRSPSRPASSSHPFTESFQRYTSLPSIGASGSLPSSSHRSHHRMSPSLSDASSVDGTAFNSLPPLRSLHLPTPAHTAGSPLTQASITTTLPDSHHHPHHRDSLPESFASDRIRRNSVMRLENILNSTSVDIGSQIPRPQSVGGMPHTVHSRYSEAERGRPGGTVKHPRIISATVEAPERRPDFRVISGWGQVDTSSKGRTENDDDGGSVGSTEAALLTMDVDMGTPPPASASTTASTSISLPFPSKPLPDSISLPKASASSSQTKTKPKRKVKMHPCSECHKEFPRPSGLRTHMTIHTKEKPFSCTYPGCTRTFSVVSNAKRHMRSHGVTDPSNPSYNHQPHSKGKERAFVVDFDEPVVVDTSPPNSANRLSSRGEVKLKWPAKGMGMPGNENGNPNSNSHGPGPMVGGHRGTRKRASSAKNIRNGSDE